MSESGESNTKVILVVDPEICIGIGQCEVLEPDVFEIDDDAISRVVGTAEFGRARANEIIFACPSNAIRETD